ncbi:MAG: hypothetical protein WC337_10700, partial [Candidatus Muiribacteriota bacterium]
QEIRVTAYSNIAEDILEMGMDPLPGEEIEIKGSLRVREEGRSLALYIQAPEHIKISGREAVEDKNFWDISKEDEGKYFNIKGIINRIEPSPTNAPGRITIKSEDGKSGEITVWNNVLNSITLSQKENFVSGAEFTARVYVNVYRDRTQLILNYPGSFKLTGKKLAAESIEEKVEAKNFNLITKADEGKKIKITGIVDVVEPSNTNAPGRIKILDKNGNSSELTIWTKVLDGIRAVSGSGLKKGADFEAVIKVNIYRDNLQMIVENTEDFKLTGQVSTVTQSSQPKQSTQVTKVTEKITSAYNGRVVELNGTINQIFNLESRGVQLKKILLAYNFGEIDLIIWQDVLEKINADLQPGFNIQIKAEVEIYRNAPQLVLKSASNLQVLSKTAVSANTKTVQNFNTETEMFTESVTSEHKGKILKISGKVYNRSKLGAGVKYVLRYNNEKDRMNFLVWNNLIKHEPGLENLSDGTEIVVEGKIDVYQGNIEIIPAHTAQIQILGGK